MGSDSKKFHNGNAPSYPAQKRSRMEVLAELRKALRDATENGLLDRLQAECQDPNSINDFTNAALAYREGKETDDGK